MFKIKTLINAFSLGPIIIVAVVSDMIMGLVCNWNEVKEANILIKYGKSIKESAARHYWFGRGLGQLTSAIGLSETISESYNDLF